MSLRFYFNLFKDKYVRWRFNRHSAESGQGSVILMFHHVSEICPKGVSESCYSSITDFSNLLNKLSKSKQFISLSELCKYLQSGVVPKDKVVITFDDVPADVYYNAVPILKELCVPYTLFISTSLIGSKGFLSSKQIIELANDPLCTIGSHTISHCKLKNTGVNIQKELQGSKETLEQLIHKPVEHFAYPYGTPFAISRRVIRQVKKSGLYRSAVCTIPAFINKYSINNMFSLPRIHSHLFTTKYNNI